MTLEFSQFRFNEVTPASSGPTPTRQLVKISKQQFSV